MWINQEYKYSCFQKLALNVLKQGTIPEHVAFIMDGNRRHAVSQDLQKMEGHKQGLTKLSEVLRWCNDFGIKEVSVYAFSIENFKRPDDEVSFLMNFAAEKLGELVENKDKINEQGVRVRILGNLNMLPVKFQRSAAQVILMTQYNSRATLNIMMPYTTRADLTSALETIRRGVQRGLIKESDVSQEVISRSSQLRACRPLDIIVRTSGEVRLSDFMIWQASCSASLFSCVAANWPKYTFWHLAAALLQFQAGAKWGVPQRLVSLDRFSTLGSGYAVSGGDGDTASYGTSTLDLQEDANKEASRTRLAGFYATLEREYLEDLGRLVSMTNSSDADSLTQ